jgi:hypothetical protein
MGGRRRVGHRSLPVDGILNSWVWGRREEGGNGHVCVRVLRCALGAHGIIREREREKEKEFVCVWDV